MTVLERAGLGMSAGMTFWQRFLARPPIRAWAVGVVPALAIVLITFMASDKPGVRFAGAFVAATVMHGVAAFVWPRVLDRDG